MSFCSKRMLPIVMAALLFLTVLACLACGAECQSPTSNPQSLVLLDFYSDTCGPCQAMKPTVDGLLKAGYPVERINVDENRPLAAKYGVRGIPCFVMVQDGRETDRVIGQTNYARLETMFQAASAPHPAWRYERPEGHRAAVVRIFCQDDSRTRSIGSGTLVTWKGRLLILTARHVVQDAKKILVWVSTGKTYSARVLSTDATWDVAVLVTDTPPEGVEPAELELGAPAKQAEGDHLESCGYGPDGKLACNSGLFLGYRRSNVAPRGPDDWMVISGHARGGDSGGPVFNRRGRLVGVLWGTDGKEVVCVQPGRLHVLLDAAVKVTTRDDARTLDSQPATLHFVALRTPTPPVEPNRPIPIESLPCCPEQKTLPASLGGPGKNVDQQCLPLLFGRRPAPTPPTVIVQPDLEVRRSLGSIDSKLDVLIRPREQPRPAEDKDDISPLLAGLCVLAAVVAGCVVYFATQSKS